MKRIILGAVAAGIVGLASHAHADTILTTFDKTYSASQLSFYTSTGRYGISATGTYDNTAVAVPFTLTATTTIQDVIALIATNSTGTYDIGIVANASGTPSQSSFINGDFLSGTASSQSPQTPADQKVNWTLNPGSYYVLAIATSGSVFWAQTSSNVHNVWDGLSNWTGQWFTSTQYTPGVELLGVPTPTPLPAALPLFGGGLAVIGLLSRRRKARA